MWFLILQRLSFDFFGHILFFPFWWYTVGAFRAAKTSLRFLADGNDMLVPSLWARNIFVPMFGQSDWQGRIMSFFIRLMNVVIRSLLLMFWLLIAIILFFLWLAAPIIVIYMLIRSFR